MAKEAEFLCSRAIRGLDTLRLLQNAGLGRPSLSERFGRDGTRVTDNVFMLLCRSRREA